MKEALSQVFKFCPLFIIIGVKIITPLLLFFLLSLLDYSGDAVL